MKITAQEREQTSISKERLAEAITEFRARGYVTLEGVMPDSLVEDLRREYEDVFAQKMKRFGIATIAEDETRGRTNLPGSLFHPLGGNHDLNRWNMHLPSRMPFIDERLFANPIAMAVIDAVVGRDSILKRVASDTPMPGATNQTVHRDLHVDVDSVQVTANIPLVDTNQDNGPLEIWPCTHLRNHEDPDEAFNQKPYPWTKEEIAQYAKTHPPERQTVPAGTFIIRDLRILHRGSPNVSPHPRPMLSLAYRPPPRDVPHPKLANALARAALFAREQSRQNGEVNPKLLDAANMWGRHVENSAASDRDYRRKIPAEAWAGFSPRARELFRYATVEGVEMSTWSVARSAKLVAAALAAVPQGVYLHARKLAEDARTS